MYFYDTLKTDIANIGNGEEVKKNSNNIIKLSSKL